MNSTTMAADLAVTECSVWLHFPRWTLLPESPVYTLRGLLGEALIAVLHPGLSRGADPPEDSPFWPLFKPSKRDPKVQRPCFLLDCPQGAGGAVSLSARLRLFGTGQRYWGVLLEALRTAERLGFGAGDRTPFEVETGAVVASALPWATNDAGKADGNVRFALDFVTPAQLTVRLDDPVGKVGLADLLELERARLRGVEYSPFALIPYAVANSVVRGLASLAAAYGGGSLGAEGWHEAALRQTRVLRYSLWPEQDVHFSENKRVDLGGVMGHVEMDGPQELLHIMRCGELIGVGAHTGFGCGRIRGTLL